MNSNDFYGGGYYSAPSWEDFTFDDEKRARSRFSRFFLAVSVFLIASNAIILLAQLVIALIMGDAAEGVFTSDWFVWGANVFGMYLFALPILYLMVRKMRSTYRTKSKMPIREFLILFVIAESLMIIGSGIGTTLNEFIGALMGREVTDTTSELIENSPIIYIILVAVIIGPIVEELIFRKLLMDKLGIYGDRLAIIVSAISFGLFHGNFYQLFYAALLGFVLAYMYSRTSNIIYPIVMHMLLNFFGSIIPLMLAGHFDRYLELEEIIAAGGAYDITEYNRVLTIVGAYSLFQYAMLIGGVFLIYKLRRRFYVTDRCEIQIPKHRRAFVALVNPGAILFLAVIAVTMVFNIIFV